MRSVQSSALKDPKVDVLVDVVAVVSVLLEVVKLDVVSVMLNVELVLTVPVLLCELLLVLETVTEVLEVKYQCWFECLLLTVCWKRMLFLNG